MEENITPNKGLQMLRDRFKMNPPDDVWKKLDADLERQRTMLYRDRGNRFKMLSIVLALLLVSFVSYFFLSTNRFNSVGDSSRVKITDAASISGVTATSKGEERRMNTLLESNSSVVSSSTKNNSGAKSNSNTSTAVMEEKAIQNSSSKNIINENNGAKETITSANESGLNPIKEAVRKIESDETNLVFAKTFVQSKTDKAEEDKLSETTVNSGDSTSKQPMKDSIAAKEKSKISHWTLSAFYGPNIFAENRLKVLNEKFVTLINSYSDLSVEDYSFNSGLLLGYNLAKHWSVSSGGIYSTIAYTSTYSTLHASIGSDNLYHYKYHSSCGSLEIPNDENVVLKKTDSLKTSATCSQVIKILSVPIMIKYQTTRNRFTMYATTGIAVNFIMNQIAKVQIASSNYTITNTITGQKKMNYSYLIGTGLDYNLNNGMSIFIESSFNTSITSLTNNGFYNCYPYSFGFHAGLTLHL